MAPIATTLAEALRHWPASGFARVLKQALENQPTGTLPLEAGTSRGGIVDDSQLSVTVISTTADENTIHARIGVFFHEIVGGCSCGDDPASENAYCEMLVAIDRTSARAEFRVIDQA